MVRNMRDWNDQEASMIYNGLNSFFIQNVDEEEARKKLLKAVGKELLRRNITSVSGFSVHETMKELV